MASCMSVGYNADPDECRPRWKAFPFQYELRVDRSSPSVGTIIVCEHVARNEINSTKVSTDNENYTFWSNVSRVGYCVGWRATKPPRAGRQRRGPLFAAPHGNRHYTHHFAAQPDRAGPPCLPTPHRVASCHEGTPWPPCPWGSAPDSQLARPPKIL